MGGRKRTGTEADRPVPESSFYHFLAGRLGPDHPLPNLHCAICEMGTELLVVEGMPSSAVHCDHNSFLKREGSRTCRNEPSLSRKAWRRILRWGDPLRAQGEG